MSTGVIKILGTAERSYYTAEDVMSILGVSRSKAFKKEGG